MKILWMALSIATTVCCWGLYGPILHWGQAEMQGSRLRPFICVGVAYFAVAILTPLWLIGMGLERDAQWTSKGILWSIVGGLLGAVGALGIIMAFNFKGSPWVVMPLVFGGAPVVNTLFNVWYQSRWSEVSPFFYAGLILVIVGTATLFVFAPRPRHAPTASGHSASAAEPAPPAPKSGVESTAPTASSPDSESPIPPAT